MSIEAGVLVDRMCRPIYWHTPDDRNSGALPDSRNLWEIIWQHRNSLGGFAHSHPGRGVPRPSHTDITTFAAIDTGLGRNLHWWIASADHLVMNWRPGFYERWITMTGSPPVQLWLARLRELSNYDNKEV